MSVVLLRTDAPADAGAPLRIFFAGWGMDEHPFGAWRTHCASGTIAIVFDHAASPDADGALAALLRRRPDSPVLLCGWSFGVRAAAEWAAALPDRERARIRAVRMAAGTLSPVDRRLGIAPAVAALTQRTLSDASIGVFRRRMTGDAWPAMSSTPPLRTTASLAAELERFRATEGLAAPELPADVPVDAHIPEADVIMPAAAQKRFWEGLAASRGSIRIHAHPGRPHGDFELLTRLLAEDLPDAGKHA